MAPVSSPVNGTGCRGRGGAAAWILSYTASATESGSGAIRDWAQPLYTSFLYALALIGVAVARRRFVALALAILAYQSVAAMVFVGATRYRVATDFLLALLAAAAFERFASRRGRAP